MGLPGHLLSWVGGGDCSAGPCGLGWWPVDLSHNKCICILVFTIWVCTDWVRAVVPRTTNLSYVTVADHGCQMGQAVGLGRGTGPSHSLLVGGLG